MPSIKILSLIYFLRSRHALFKKTYKISFTPGHFLAEIHLNLCTPKNQNHTPQPCHNHRNGTHMRHQFLSPRKRQVVSPPVIKSMIKSNYPKSTPTHSEPPNHTSPKNSNRISKEFTKMHRKFPNQNHLIMNPKRVLKEFPKNSQRIP